MSKRDLPDIEAVSAAVHDAWMASKRASGVTTRKSESGEELMVPYADLSEPSKELDRGTVRTVYAAIEAAGGEAAGNGPETGQAAPGAAATVRTVG